MDTATYNITVNNPPTVSASDSFKNFCEFYFPRKFCLAWSPDHLKVIDAIEQAVIHGGLFALAMPRGSGKTSISEVAGIWAMVAGHHVYPFLVGNSEDHALRMLEDIKSELSYNDLLLDDYPEVCFPIRCLEGQARRCLGQLYYDQPTHIGWGANKLVLPTIPGSRASGALIHTAGITGNIRGAVHTRPDGRSVRPRLVIIDDPQTDESAHSPSQCQRRISTINGAILNLAGPTEKISAVMPCTVIAPGDLADTLLDREMHPAWQGMRVQIRFRSLRQGGQARVIGDRRLFPVLNESWCVTSIKKVSIKFQTNEPHGPTAGYY